MFPLLLFLIKFDQYAIIAAALQIIWIFQKERLPVEFHGGKRLTFNTVVEHLATLRSRLGDDFTFWIRLPVKDVFFSFFWPVYFVLFVCFYFIHF